MVIRSGFGCNHFKFQNTIEFWPGLNSKLTFFLHFLFSRKALVITWSNFCRFCNPQRITFAVRFSLFLNYPFLIVFFSPALFHLLLLFDLTTHSEAKEIYITFKMYSSIGLMQNYALPTYFTSTPQLLYLVIFCGNRTP